MKYRQKPVTAAMLILCLLLSIFCNGTALAEPENITAGTEKTPVYFLLKEEPAGRWLETYNYIHSININGTVYPAYCVESSKRSPEGGTKYFAIDGSQMQYSETMMSGMREILRNGYPYTTRICGYDFGTDTVKAQAATQVALRMWASYRKEQENAKYNVFSFWNPEPKRGNALVKAGTAPGAQEVYEAAIALFRLAKSGQQTVIEAACDFRVVEFPKKRTGGEYLIAFTVTMQNCEYATLAFDVNGAEITEVSKGTPERIENGATVTVRVPGTEAGSAMTVVAYGYSTKTTQSLRFYAEQTGHMQRLFVGRTDVFGVSVREYSVEIPDPPEPPTGPVEISKTSLAASSSGSKEGESGELKGAHLQILDSEGNVVFEWVTDGKAKELNAVLEAGATYTLHEVSAPQGYTVAPDQTFTVRADGTLSKVVMEDKPTHVEISKKSALDGSLIKGAKMQILDGNTVVYEWVTDGQVRSLVGLLTAGKKYTLRETEAPKGYLKAEDVSFTVSTNGTTDKVEMTDYYTRVLISKISLVNGEELKGAEMSLEDSKGQVVANWVTDGTETRIDAELVPGERYTLRETKAPKGYLLAEAVSFSYEAGTPKVVMKDAPTVIRTSKKDAETGLPLPGAQMQILDGTGNVVEEWVSNGTIHNTVAKLTAGERYVLHEVKAPQGYVRSEDVAFVVPESTEGGEIEFYNAKMDVGIPSTGDSAGRYVFYGIFAFLAAVNTGYFRYRSWNKKN